MPNKTLSIILSVKNKLAAGLSAARSQMHAAGQAIGGAFKAVGKAIAGVSAAIGASMVRAEMFRSSIAKIAATSSYSMAEVAADVKQLAAAYGVSKTEVAEGFGAAVGAGYEKSARAIAEIGSRMSATGLASVPEAVKLITTALNAYGLAATDAASVADTLVAASTRSGASIADMAAGFGRIAPIAAAAGVSLSDLAAAYATLARGGNATTAFQSLQGVIVGLNKTLGSGWSDSMTFAEGIAALAGRAGGSTTELQSLTGSIQAASAVLRLTGANAIEAATDIEAVAGAAGTLDAAFEKVGDQAPLSRLKQGVDSLVASFGELALSGVGGFLDSVSEKMAAFQTRIDAFFKQGGGIVVAQFCEEAVANIGHMVSNVSARFRIVGSAISDTFAWGKEIVGATVAWWAARLKWVADYAVAVWEKVKHPTEDFRAPELDASAADARFAEAIGKSAIDIYRETLSRSVALENAREAQEEAILAISEKYAKKKEEFDRKRIAEEKARAAAGEGDIAEARRRAKERGEAALAEAEAELAGSETAAIDTRNDRLREQVADAKLQAQEIADAQKRFEEAAENADRRRQGLLAKPQERAEERHAASRAAAEERTRQRMEALMNSDRVRNGTLKPSRKMQEYMDALKAKEAAAAALAGKKGEGERMAGLLAKIDDRGGEVRDAVRALEKALVG